MYTFGRLLIYAAVLFGSSSCAIVLRRPSSVSVQGELRFSTIGSISTYTCAPIILSALDISGQPWVARTNTPVTLGGLGQGNAYSSLADCQTGSNSTSTLFIGTGNSNVTFYYRSNTAEAVTFTASTSSLATATSSVTTNLFQTLGQPGPTRNVQYESGENSPLGVFCDGTRLFVADTTNHRVLVWNTIPTSNGQAPSFVLGQNNLVSRAANTGGVSASTMNYPTAVFSTGTMLFVADYSNHRVLVWNSMPTTNGQAASLVLGQPNSISSTQNNGGVLASTLSYPSGVYSIGTKVFVSDTGNNRVLVWNTFPTVSGQAADFALGQPNLVSSTANNGGRSGSTLRGPDGISGFGTQLFVADGVNNRILVWNALPTFSGQSADFALGQTDLVSGSYNSGGLSGSCLGNPFGVATDGTRLFVGDVGNHRVLVWNTIPTVNGQSASFALGQPNLTSNASNNGGISGSTMYSPYGVSINGANLFVAEYDNHRTLVWNAIPTLSGQVANLVMGQPNFTSRIVNNRGVSGSTLAGAAGVYSNGTQLFIADTSNNRVLMWNTFPTSDGQTADLVLGQPNLTSNTSNNGGISASTLSGPYGVFCDGVRLIVADTGNQRILIWSSLPTTHGQAADLVLGQPDFVSNTINNGGISGTSLYNPRGVFSDGTRLYIADTYNHRILIWNALPTSNAQSASIALGQPNLTSNTPNNGGISGTSLLFPAAVHSDGTHVFVADTNNHRVLGWNAIPTGNAQLADFALGQASLATAGNNSGGLSASSLSSPWGIYVNNSRLYLADSGNSRILIWSSIPTSNAQAANYVFGQPNFTSNTSNNGGLSGTSLSTSYGIYVDTTRMFIAELINLRALIAPVPGI